METYSYNDIRKQAEIISQGKSVLDYFFSLCETGNLRYEGKQGKEYFFAHPHQRTGSIAVSDKKNKWYDHSQGVGGDIINAIRHFEQKNFTEAIALVDKSIHPYRPPVGPKTASKAVEFNIVKESDHINHPALVKYIRSRGLEPGQLSGMAQEIHWAKGGKKFFGIGFINDRDGYAIRSSIFKFNIGPNHVTNIQIGTDPVGIKIFEGGFDLASFKKLNPSASYHAIVLNGLANLSPHYMEEINSRAISLNFPIDLYLDNDLAGDKKTTMAKQLIKNAEDRRVLYQNFQDLNDYLVSEQTRKLGR